MRDDAAHGGMMTESVRLVDLATVNEKSFKGRFVGCVVLTRDNKILLQQRPHDFVAYPDYLCEFGGRIETGEQPINALVRELNEELGANVNKTDVISFGAITESMSNHTELVYVYFWHDKAGSITGCYEGSPRYFDNVAAILAYPKITDGLRWLLGKCQKQKLL